MNRKRIAIACQGGGSQCAFVAGALNTLLVERRSAPLQDRRAQRNVGRRHHRRAGLDRPAQTGARRSGAGRQGDHRLLEGSVRAHADRDRRRRVRHDDAAAGGARRACPRFASSPSSPRFQLDDAGALEDDRQARVHGSSGAAGQAHRLRRRCRRWSSPTARCCCSGRATCSKVTSRSSPRCRARSSVDAVLASAAIPNLFPAVWVDGHAYWDGIFSPNPPVMSFLRQAHDRQGQDPQRDLGDPGQSQPSTSRCPSGPATSSIAATTWPAT